ncbi:MAG: hypothetical protein ACI9N9_001706 [Enterobacterales bacterium]|jgi:hypothetical protein
MPENIIENPQEGDVLVISACPADVQLCLGVIKEASENVRLLIVVTWANSEMQESLRCVFQQNENLSVTVSFRSGIDAYGVAQEKRWASIYLFTMGAEWLGKILYERKDVLRYRDCYMDYDQLAVRDIDWHHSKIIKFHGLKYWLKLQVSRALTFIRCHRYKLEFRPDMHVWPQTEDIKSVWKDVVPDRSFKLSSLPRDAVIFCFSSTDNGWAPDWTVLRAISDNFFYKLHPRTGRVDYLGYPDWVKPLTGYDLPMELYDCPDSSLLVGTTSTALGSSINSISLWQIKLSDWKETIKKYGIASVLFKASSMNNLNCRDDLYYYYNAYSIRATYVPKNNRELLNSAFCSHIRN